MKTNVFSLLFLVGTTSLCWSETRRGGTKRIRVGDYVSLEKEDSTGITFKNSYNEKVYLTYNFLGGLTKVRERLTTKVGVGAWEMFLSSRLSDAEKREAVNCIKSVVFYENAHEKNTIRCLEELVFFDRTKSIPFSFSILVVELAHNLRYTRTKRLCKRIMSVIKNEPAHVRMFLRVIPIARGANSEYEDHPEYFINELIEARNKVNFRLRDYYVVLKKMYSIQWLVRKSVLKELFSTNTFLSVLENTHEIDNAVSKLRLYKTLIKIRMLDYPEESRSYVDFLNVLTTDEVQKANLVMNKKEPTVIEVALDGASVISEYVLRFRWCALVLSNDVKIVTLLRNSDREVDFLTIKSTDRTIVHRETRSSRRIVVHKVLTLEFANGSIGFVDTTKVKKTELIGVRALDFSRCSGMFTSLQRLYLFKCNLSALVMDDDKFLFPSVRFVKLNACSITSDVYRVIPRCALLVQFDFCDFCNDTKEEVFHRLKCKCLYIENDKEIVIKVLSDEDATEVGERGDGVASACYVGVSPSLAERLARGSDADARRETIGNMIVCCEMSATENAMFMEIAELIVFLIVGDLDDYLKLKRSCCLRSLRYLEFVDLEYTGETAELRDASVHALEVLVVSSLPEADTMLVTKELFDKNALLGLDVVFSSGNDADGESIRHFQELRVLVIQLGADASYEETKGLFDAIHELRKLEVLELTPESSDTHADGRIDYVRLSKRMLNGCKRLRRIVVTAYDLQGLSLALLGLTFVTDDGRRYVLTTEFSSEKMNVCARACGKVRLVDTKMQSMLLTNHVVHEEYVCDFEDRKSMAVLVYSLEGRTAR